MFVVIGDIKALYCTMLKKSLPSIIYVDMFTIEKKIELKHIEYQDRHRLTYDELQHLNLVDTTATQ